jgi:hypothetical protein
VPPKLQWICTSLHGVTRKTIVLIGSVYSLSLSSYLFGLLLDPEDGGSTFVRNVHGLPRCYIPEDSTLYIPEGSTHKDLFCMFPAEQSRDKLVVC